MKNKLLRFFGYRCPRCGNDIWLAGAPEKYIYRAFLLRRRKSVRDQDVDDPRRHYFCFFRYFSRRS